LTPHKAIKHFNWFLKDIRTGKY